MLLKVVREIVHVGVVWLRDSLAVVVVEVVEKRRRKGRKWWWREMAQLFGDQWPHHGRLLSDKYISWLVGLHFLSETWEAEHHHRLRTRWDWYKINCKAGAENPPVSHFIFSLYFFPQLCDTHVFKHFGLYMHSEEFSCLELSLLDSVGGAVSKPVCVYSEDLDIISRFELWPLLFA